MWCSADAPPARIACCSCAKEGRLPARGPADFFSLPAGWLQCLLVETSELGGALRIITACSPHCAAKWHDDNEVHAPDERTH